MAEARNSLERTASYTYPTGHLNHLSAGQLKTLDDFKQLCQQNGYYSAASSSSPASHDDETLLRYLRARKFVPKDAFTQFKDTEEWRKANKLEELYDTIDVDEYDETRRLYPQWTGRRDKRGIPVYVFEVANLDSKKMASYESSAGKPQGADQLPAKLQRLFALYENLTKFVMPLCSSIPTRPHPETPVSQSNNIVDISKVGLRQFWNLKAHMQDASTLATAHYPETLDRIFIIGAPSFFPTVWSWVKRWFDPITVSKIFILGAAEVKPTLEKFMDIDNIPRKYGGNLDWEWGSLPSLDPEIAKVMGIPADGSKTIPTGPIRWKPSKDGSKFEGHAVGSKGGKQRDEVVAEIDSKLFNQTTTGTQNASEASEKPLVEGKQSSAPAAASTTHPEANMSNSENRDGTSIGKFAAQNQTLAEGQLEHATPETRDHGYGDKTTVMEPKTVGQAAKDVNVPEAKKNDPSYLEEAQSAMNTATSAAYDAGAKVLAATGLTGAKKEEKTQEVKETPHDPRIDNIGKEHVEDFIRAQQTSSLRTEDLKANIDKQ